MDLNHAGQVKFDRIFDRDDLALTIIEAAEQAVDGGGLTRSGWTGDQHNTVGLLDQLGQSLSIGLGHTQFGELRNAAGLAQQTHDDRFAPGGGQGRDPKVDILTRYADGLAAILRQAAFANIHARQELNARTDRVKGRARRSANRLQNAIDPHADKELVFEGLDVNVRGPHLNALGKDRVHEVDDGSLFGQFAQARGV